MKAKLTSKEGAWFRDQHAKSLAELRQLRQVLTKFCEDLDEHGLMGRLLSKELRDRVAKIPKT